MPGIVETLLIILIVLAIVGLIFWGLSHVPGLPPFVRPVLWVVVGVILLLWLLSLVTGGSLSLR